MRSCSFQQRGGEGGWEQSRSGGCADSQGLAPTLCVCVCVHVSSIFWVGGWVRGLH